MKKFDSTKLFKLACQDVVERFHLLISLLFVLVRRTNYCKSHTVETQLSVRLVEHVPAGAR